MDDNIGAVVPALESALLGGPMRPDDIVMPWQGWLAFCALRYAPTEGDATIDPILFAAHVQARKADSWPEARLWRWAPSAPLITFLTHFICTPEKQPNEPTLLLPILADLRAHVRDAKHQIPTAIGERVSRCFGDVELFAPNDQSAQRIVAKYHRKWLGTFAALGRREVILALPSAFAGAELTEICDRAALATRDAASLIDLVEALRTDPEAPVSPLARDALPVLDPKAYFDHLLLDYVAPYLAAKQVDLENVIAKLNEFATVERLYDGREPPALLSAAMCALKHAPTAGTRLFRRGLRTRDERLQAGFVEAAAIMAVTNERFETEIEALLVEQPERRSLILAAAQAGRDRARPEN